MSGDFTFLKGNIETIILCSLYNGDKYGYEIAKEIKERTENQYEIKQPTLYAYLKRLEAQEYIFSYWGAESNGGRRRYYKLTEGGRKNCEKFMAEWKYHRSVLDNLVDDGEITETVTQEEVTQLFGTKQKRPRKTKAVADALTEQELIAERLRKLENAENEETTPREEISADGETQVTEAADDDASDSKILRTDNADHDGSAASDQSGKAVFSVKQDDADEFMERFERRAKELSERDPAAVTADTGENYQHVLMNVLGDQLDDMENFAKSQSVSDESFRYTSDRPVALEDVADEFAKQGIRLRIYNRATANYKSKTLMPVKKVYCITSWFTFAAAFVLLGLLCVLSYKSAGITVYAVTAGVIALVPIILTFMTAADPSRKNKPSFNFRTSIIATVIIALVTILFAFGINIILDIKFSDFGAVATRILIPTVIALLLPIAVIIYNALYKKY